jgi:type I restriction enzyme, S subunit
MAEQSKIFPSAAFGVRIGQWDLFIAGICNIPIIIPPPDEQELIVRFLDWASVRLGKAIAPKRKVIGFLEEQKQALIHRAVTRGLDDTFPLKPSGLDSLGDVPELWEILRAGSLFSERKQQGISGLPMLVVSLNTGVSLAGEVDHRGREKPLIADVAKYSVARAGDIAYNIMRLWKGAVGFVPEDCLVSPAYVLATPRIHLANGSFYELVFRTDGQRSRPSENQLCRNSYPRLLPRQPGLEHG